MCQYFYPEYVSSATLPTELAEDLVMDGLTVDVLCGYPKEYYDGKNIPRNERYNGINIHRVKYTRFNNKNKIGRITNFCSFFIAILMRSFNLFKYKCILVYSNPPLLPLIPYVVSRLSKVKFVFVAFDLYPDNALVMRAIKKGGIIEKIMHFINKKVYKYADSVVAIGTEMKQYMISHGIAINPEIINIIPNWYSEEKLSSPILISDEFRRLREKWPFIVLYSGNMGACQDMETILKTVSRFKNNENIFFIFTGHGNKLEYVKRYININGINNAKVYGFLLGTDYSDVLNIADVCLVSLEKGIEGLGVPSKTYGYFAAGKPVLAIMSYETDIVKNLNEYNAGGSVLQTDVDGFENLIWRFMENKELVRICGENAKAVFHALYDRQICTDMYYKLITRIINETEEGDIRDV
ncbi:MAG: glycosyltransferase family 4 protein [Veillonellales bacterium]